MVIRVIPANAAWDHAVSLDKHTVSSVPIGENEQGHMQFNTVRTAVGEAMFKLKYRQDFTQVNALAQKVADAVLGNGFPKIDIVIPMPASKSRAKQPVTEIAKQVAALLSAQFVDDLLIKVQSTGVMKDLGSYAERAAALENCFQYQNKFTSGQKNVLLVDDLYDTGATLEAACNTLRGYSKINTLSVVALTRRT